MKAGQIRYWWENPDLPNYSGGVPVANEPSLSPVYSLAMHSDALWSIAGTNRGHINMFTVRHEPGRLFYVIPNAHRGPISALSLDHNEKGLFSAGWDGEAIQWDLNTGQLVRKFTVHGAQLVNIAVRPLGTPYYGISPTSSAEPDGAPYSYHDAGYSFPSGQNDSEAPQEKSIAPDILPEGVSDSAETAQPSNATTVRQAATSDPQNQDADSKSDASFDPLFDDEPDADGEPDNDSVKLEGSVARDQLPQKDSTMNPASVPPNSNITGANPVNNLHPPSQTMGRTSTVSAAPPKNAPPAFDPSMSATFSPDILMTAAINGQILLWDRRVNSAGQGVGRLWNHEAPPWCVSACWSTDGSQIYIGRRKATLDVWDIRQLGRSGPAGTPRLLKTLRNPPSSGAVSCVVPFPDGRHIACASSDNIRLWNAAEAGESEGIGKSKSGVQFKIIPGHHGGFVSQMVVDPGARFLVSASSNRGWHGESTRTVFVHDIKAVQ
ncbi:hypothetical protein SERLA73DRAFT_189759 [Serpula lacrymans var. lacrymans S7.3]|uniref:Transcription factor spt8 beta-propeller domain-containing protein n=2 Tax=Serpula lacrymans var. lacrymans TaxID=341189 RepID=F8QEI9_SERL3|nr:uncharacterized protein SERLADRAFT_480840 [Serpula lacrymans var. lacrymans S7.9]EGN93245.1 hypothetical protein SERLA73DRAFT_189759 [Serpula lacrymans var. lacrymans S7.3]EGO18630.1 hypothetical protein SERLADRAFT_480840 [Serpula lacrymans var. lacrymans S7.9]